MNPLLVGRVVLAASLIALVMSVFTSYKSREYSQCQGRYNEIINQRTRALTEGAEKERQATRAVIDASAALWLAPAISKPANQRTPQDQAELTRLFTAYQNALQQQKTANAEADETRRSNPVPKPPSDLCG